MESRPTKSTGAFRLPPPFNHAGVVKLVNTTVFKTDALRSKLWVRVPPPAPLNPSASFGFFFSPAGLRSVLGYRFSLFR